jgi:ADP-ribose pyrophosphatase
LRNHSSKLEFNHNDVIIEQEKFVYHGFFRLKEYRLRHRLFAGGWSETITREVFVRGDAVGVLLYDPKRQAVVMVEQFRTGAIKDAHSAWLIEIVAGGIPEGEEPAAIAIKEVFEETGLEVSKVQPMVSYYASPGGNAEKFHLFYAIIDASLAGGIYGLKDEHEDIRVCVFSLEECMQAVAAGSVSNAMTLIALQWLQLHYQQL